MKICSGNRSFRELKGNKSAVLKKISLLKRQLPDSVEFITIMIFDNMESVKEFAGKDYEQSYVPDEARKVLLKYNKASQHYSLVEEHMYDS